jgi:hemolysin activation/secretion protein
LDGPIVKFESGIDMTKRLVRPEIVRWVVMALVSFPVSLAALAQTVPDAGSLLQQQQIQPNRLNQPPKPDLKPLQKQELPAQAAQGLEADKTTIVVKTFTLTGALTVFTPEQLQTALTSFVNRPLSLTDLQEAANAITLMYRQGGYFLARAYLPKQDVTAGSVTIAISEGLLDTNNGVRTEGAALRIKVAEVLRVVDAAAPAGKPLNQDALERSLLLLNDIPGVSATANLEGGSTPGTTRLALELTEAPAFNGNATLDNYGSRYTGSDRLTANFNLNDTLGYGEQFTVQAIQALQGEGSNYSYARLGYSQPVGSTGARAGLAYSSMLFAVGQELSSLQAKGTADNWTVNLRYPLIRSRERSLYAIAAYDRKTLFNEANGARTSDKLVDVASIGLNLEQSDTLGGGAYNYAGITVSAGTLDLGRDVASLASDQAAGGPRSQGSFEKLNWNATRLQRATEKLSFAALFSGQTASKNLDSGEKFQLGGPSGVRAYPAGEATGDEGLRATLEARYFAGTSNDLGDVNLQAFYDWGSVRQFRDPGLLAALNDYSLSGIGLGITISRSGRFEAKAQWAQKIGSNPNASANGNDSDGTSNSNRVWLSLTAFF